MTTSIILDTFNLPKKYTRCLKEDCIEVLLHKYWIRNLLRCHRVPEFTFHDKYSDDEVCELFKQGESLSSEWCHSIISVFPKENKMVVPLHRAKFTNNEDMKLSLSQIMQSVAQANYKHLWKNAYKKYNYGCCTNITHNNERIPFMNYNELIKEIIGRLFGVPVFKLGDSQFSDDSSYPAHLNLLPVFAAIETSKAFFIFQRVLSNFTVLDCVNFSPAKLSSPLAAPLFVIYQLLHLMRHANNMGLVLGDITLQDIYIDENLWIKILPKIKKNIIERDEQFQEAATPLDNLTEKMCQFDLKQDTVSSETNADELNQLCIAWTYGAISNYDYLYAVNRLAGRKINQPHRNYVMPWVSDLSGKSGSNWRDLTKSKFRLNKGDCQLDRTFQIEPNSNQVAHHVPEVLSEITYYVYLARVTPRSILCKYVRSQWVPGEYPASIQRLQQWTPDECIPEFFSDPNVFRSIHTDLGDLQVPGWASSPHDFIAHHRSMLESPQVSSMLHHWIDLTFGYKLSGNAAVKAKNVCLNLVDGHKALSKGGVVQLFHRPHPHRVFPSPYWSKNPPNLHCSSKRFCEEEFQGNACLEDDEPLRASNLFLSKFINRSKTNYSSAPLAETGQQAVISLPKDYNPCLLLNSLELIHNFNKYVTKDLDCSSRSREKGYFAHYKQLIMEKQLRQSQVIGCLIVEIFLAPEVRAFGNGVKDLSFDERFKICKNIASHNMQALPKCVHFVVRELLQIDGLKEDKFDAVYCCQLPCAHSLLQPLLSPLSFPPLLPLLFSCVTSLQTAESPLGHQEDFTSDITVTNKMNELKVKGMLSAVEALSEEGGACLELFVPYFKQLLTDPESDVVSAWYIFDHVARGLGPEMTTKLLLDSVLRLYDWEVAVQTDIRLLHKRIKLYHRSFLLRLIVRFGFQTFLDSFIIPLVEAVGGYHDLDLGKTPSYLDYTEGEECPEDIISPMSPMDEDSLASSDKVKINLPKESEDVEFTEEDMLLEEERRGPKSAKSLQNLLIDNIDPQFTDEKEVETQPEEISSKFVQESNEGGSWLNRRTFSMPHYEQGDSQHTKFVCEVCQVSAESLLWLSHRLGPVLTARHLTRNLLRMLALCYSGTDRLSEDSRTASLPADRHSTCVLHCLISIAELYGEQLIVLQYLPHMIELIAQSKRKMTQNLEGGIIGCLVLLSSILHVISDSTFADILQDVIIRSVIGPCLRVVGSQSLPSGTTGRKALATKLVQALSSLVARAPPLQRVSLLQSLQRFFLLFSKALNLSPDACSRNQGLSPEAGGNVKSKSRDDNYGTSPTNLYEFDNTSNKNKAMDELKEVMSSEFAYKSYEPFANFFGEKMMEQSLRNYSLIKQLCSNYLSKKQTNRIPDSLGDQMELPDFLDPSSESSLQVGSFGNVVVVGNRIDLQDRYGKSSSPIIVEEQHHQSNASVKCETMNRHLRGNWVAYWEHEIGRNVKDTKLNIKQIKLQTFVGHTNSVRHIVPLASENSFMSAGRDKTVKLWSLRSQGDGNGSAGPQWTYQGHRKSILGCGFSDRCRLAVTTDSVVHIWDPWVGRALDALSRPHIPPINTLIVLPPPSPLALSAATDSTIRSLDLRTCSFVNELKVSVSSSALIRCLDVSPSSNWLAVGQASGVTTILDMKMGTVVSQWKAHDSEILQLVAVDDHTLISSSLDQTVCVWNVSDGKLKFMLKGPSEPVHCLLSWGGEVISGSTSNRIGVHSSLESGVPTYTSTRLRSDSFKGVLTSMTLLPLNRLLLLGADTGNITLIC